MKVYLLYEVRYEMPYAIDTVLGVYSDRSKANIAKKALDDANEEPVEADSYGPMRGMEYTIEEYKVL